MSSTTAACQQVSSTLRQLCTKHARVRTTPSTHWLVPAVVSTTIGCGPTWIPHIYHHALAQLPVSDRASKVALHGRMKEALTRLSILCGVPKVIETLLALGDAVEDPDDRDMGSLRPELDLESQSRTTAGDQGLSTIYQDDLPPIFEKMDRLGLGDIKWASRNITYGTYLTPYGSQESLDILLSEHRATLSVITLSALVPQRTPREILWHLRGALRRGLNRQEVEELHSFIADVCEACGASQVREGMPSVSEVEPQQEEQEQEQEQSREA